MIEAMQSHLKKAASLIAAGALAATGFAIAPATAQAQEFSNSLSTSSVQVRFGDNTNAVQQVDFGTGADELAPTNAKLGSLYLKGGVNLIGTNSYVTLQDVIDEAADASVDDWTSVQFYVYNSKDSTYSYYTKFNNGIFPREATATTSGLGEELDFYGAADGSMTTAAAITATTPTSTIDGAVIALNGKVQTLASDGSVDADTALTNMTFATTDTADAPRLMWGYDDVLNSVAGNRFPSNIVGIQVNE